MESSPITPKKRSYEEMMLEELQDVAEEARFETEVVKEEPADVPVLLPRLSTIFDSIRYSDLTIKCKGRDIKAHRVIVCLHSKPLAACVDGNFLEAQTGVIDLSDDDPRLVELMLRYIYTGSYDLALQDHPEGFLAANTALYILGDRLDIAGLKRLVGQNFNNALSHSQDSENYLASLVKALQLIYDQIPESDRLLKDPALKVCGARAFELASRKDFELLCKERAEIGFDVLVSTTKHAEDTRISIGCSRCRKSLTPSPSSGTGRLELKCGSCYHEIKILKKHPL